ncbi:MAG TPA: hypothetical protein ENJ31_00365, partial [Anaerolineae bacterium]|nr:hypothetical protein [Anaerolineae bacterium]
MDINEHVLHLVLESLSEIENKRVPLSAVMRKCIRVAKLRNDFYNLIWLEWEMIDWANEGLRHSVLADLPSHIVREMSAIFKEFKNQWIEERKIESIEVESSAEILPKGIEEIETMMEYYERLANDVRTPTGLHPLDLYQVSKSNANAKFVFR